MSLVLRIATIIFLLIPSNWTEIGKRNTAIRDAAKAYGQAEYELAVKLHQNLISEFGINTPQANYNLALSQHYSGEHEQAINVYQSLITSSDKFIASFAHNQSGILLADQKKYQEALQAFKMSLIKDPMNESARYNYELLSRWLEENPDQDQDQDGEGDDQDQDNQQDQDKDQDQDKESQDSKDGEGDEQSDEDNASESQQKDDRSGEKSQEERDSDETSELESDLSDREQKMEQMRENLKEMNLTPEQAAQILEAMNAAELRYIQQNQKKPTKRPDRNLPDW